MNKVLLTIHIMPLSDCMVATVSKYVAIHVSFEVAVRHQAWHYDFVTSNIVTLHN